LPEIAVTASRVEEDVREVPATISTIDAREINRGLVRSPQDLIRYEPGVSVNSDPNRFGANSYNIRGLDGNRVVMQVDGIRAPNLFQFGIGPFNNSTRNFVDLDSLKRVEILRGPASTLYGSDALGGVVAYLTKDPLDYLELDRSPLYAALKSGYATADDGWANTATLAAGDRTIQGLLVYTYYTGHELENQGDNGSVGTARTEPNPQDIRQQNVLAKLTWALAPNQSLRGTYEWYDRDASVDVLSLNSSTPRTSSITGDDANQRQRYSLGYAFTNPSRGWFAGITASVYQQIAWTASNSSETRTATTATCSGVAPGASTCYIPREFDFQQRITGLTAQLESLLAGDGVAQRIVWGVDYSSTESSALRNALRINRTTGSVSNTIAGDTFPVRDFPNTTTNQFGLYVQDQISLLDDRLTITPALRYDDYDMTVHPDSIYLSNTPPGVQASDFQDSAVSPKLAVLYKVNNDLNVYAQYAFGFRAPPFDDVNAAFRNPVQSYVLVPNPNLKSETSQGLELGLKGRVGPSSYAVALFYNRYKDFIDSTTQLSCPSNPACVPGFLITFQATNLASVRIYGAEAKGEWVLDENWSLAGSIAYANGEDTTLNQPLNTVNPLTAVAGLRYTNAGGRFGGALNVTAVSPKKSAAAPANVQPFLTPGFATVDLTAYWDINRNLRIAGGIFNLFNKTYWLWSNVGTTGLTVSSPEIDRYTQPGINASVNLQLIY
jgi:hemoglobin/transferrin/lactoferrin receptor protein